MNKELIIAVALSLGAIVAGASTNPLMTMRLRVNDTETMEAWKSSFKAIADNPGCCDEIWFSTGIGFPLLDWHRKHADILAVAIADAKSKGIVPSLQFQATIGHGIGSPELFAMKTWTGWTGWKGVETKYCNCPRQPAFHEYLREVSKIYARLGFAALWIDDDLRITSHPPADNGGRHVGCFCNTCIDEFNAESGGTWTRETLAKAIETDDALFARWRKFSIDGLVSVVKTIAEVFKAESPDTMLGYQNADVVLSEGLTADILKAMHQFTGKPVGSRQGGGTYYDDDPNSVVVKSIASGYCRDKIGNPDYVSIWSPEIESYPRTYYSKSPQGVLVEGFTALMYGMNSISYFISNREKEDPELYGRTCWKTLAEASPVLRGYAKTTAGCTAVGFAMPQQPKLGIRRIAIPVLAGPGRKVGALTNEEATKTSVNKMTSAQVQKMRDDLDRRAGGLQAVVKSPFMGLMQIHADENDNLRSVALQNIRISDQGPVRLLLRKLPPSCKTMVWNEMCRKPLALELENVGGETFVTIPAVGAWNGGYLSPSAETDSKEVK